MTYSIYRINVPIPVKCDSMAVAVDTACKLMSYGTSVFQIEGSDGFMMERRDIEIECLRRGKGSRQIKA